MGKHSVRWKEYVDARFEAFSQKMDERHRGDALAVTTYSDVNQRSLALMNEFRGSLNDRERAFATVDALRGANDRIEDVRTSVGKLEQQIAASAGASVQSAGNNRTLIAVVGMCLVAVQIAIAFWK